MKTGSRFALFFGARSTGRISCPCRVSSSASQPFLPTARRERGELARVCLLKKSTYTADQLGSCITIGLRSCHRRRRSKFCPDDSPCLGPIRLVVSTPATNWSHGTHSHAFPSPSGLRSLQPYLAWAAFPRNSCLRDLDFKGIGQEPFRIGRGSGSPPWASRSPFGWVPARIRAMPSDASRVQ